MLIHEPPYMYVVVRNDLSAEQQAVQAIHASMEAAVAFLDDKQEHPHLILLKTDSNTLQKLITDMDNSAEFLNLRALPSGPRETIRYRVFVEPDFGWKTTAVATEPLGTMDPRRNVFKGLPLLKIGVMEVLAKKVGLIKY